MDSSSSRYERFERSHWAALRDSTPLTLADADLDALAGINEQLAMAEVTDIYLPVSRLLNLHVIAQQQLNEVTDTFLGSEPAPVPFIIGLAGSVAVGKSTTARVLQALLSQWPDHPRVDLITTDGFLRPNADLDANGLMERKGFPESYNTGALVDFLLRVKSGDGSVRAPVYSHLVYDIIEGEHIEVDQPDVLIVEGLNVLQTRGGDTGATRDDPRVFASDYFDFSIYVDADEAHIEQWYVDRFHALRAEVFQNPESFFRHFAGLSNEEADDVARGIWAGINAPNLRENIAPTRDRADLILRKGADHRITDIRLRK